MKKIFVENRAWFYLNGNLKEFPLFFFTDKFQNKISADFFYENFYLQSKPDFWGDFYDGVMQDKRFNFKSKDYDYTFFIDFMIDYSGQNAVIFSEKLDKQVVGKLKSFFEEKKFKIYPETLAYYVLNAYLTSVNVQKKGKIAVVNALGGTLAVSLFEIQSGIKLDKISFLGRFYEPLTYAITQSVLEDIDKIYIKLSAEVFRKKFNILYHKIKNIREKIINLENATLSVRLCCEKNRYLVNIKRNEILSEASLYAKKTIVSLKEAFGGQHNLPGKIICLGFDENDLFAEVWDKLKPKVFYMDLDSVAAKIDEKPNMVLFEQTDFLDIKNLKPGQKIKLHGYDSRPGKGKSLQILQYEGDKKFKVVESTRSLKKDDLAEAVTIVLEKEKQADFKIFRKGQLYGIFRTRPLVLIEIEVT